MYKQFNDMQKLQQDYQKNLWDRLASYTEYSGNKPALQARLQKINEIQDALAEGDQKLSELTAHVEKKTGGIPSRSKEVARDLANLKIDFDKFGGALRDVKSALENRLQQWTDYESNVDRLVAWLTEAEHVLKNFQPKNTLDEKQEYLEKFHALIASLRQNESEFDKMTDESSELIQNSGETRISASQKITSRFQSIQTTAKEIVKKCEQSVADHQEFNDKYKQCANWLVTAQNNYCKCCDI